MALDQNAQIFHQAQKLLVGGVNSPVRSFKSVRANPLIIHHGKKSRIYDENNVAYTDYCLSWGAAILGHAHRDVVAAVKKAISQGSHFGTTTKSEVDLAKIIVKNIPSIDLVRFVNSGTEATMSAIRVARGFTRKNKIIKFDGCYHGHFDDLLVNAGSGVAMLKESSSLGITQNHIAETISLPFSNTQLLVEVLEREKNNIACCILEPVAGNMGVIVPDIQFLKTLRTLTQRYKIVLIFDEIITGFRSSLNGVQSEFGIIPDMTCLGKIIGGGFPVGAYGGRKDIMNCLAPLGGVYQAGTFAGHPVVMQAGVATLKNLNKIFYNNLNQLSSQFLRNLKNFFKQHAIDAHLSSHHSMFSIRFSKKSVSNYSEAQASSSADQYVDLFNDLLQSKIYFPPADLETFFISGSHTRQDLEYLSSYIQRYFTKGV